MTKEGIDVSQIKRTQLTEDMLPQYDRIISMAQPEFTPNWLKNAPNFIFWDIKDPGGRGLEETIIARDLIKAKVTNLLK